MLVIVHEFGHFIVAKKLGIRVERFSFGFGPKIFSVKRGDTEYIVASIPLGGYVKMAGDEPEEGRTYQKWEFFSRSVSERFKVIFAGPLLNYMLAFLIFSALFMLGNPVPTTEVGSLMKGYPAESQGLLVGDKILAVDGKAVKLWEDMTEAIHKHTEGPMRFSVERKGSVFEKDIVPVIKKTKDIFGKEMTVAIIGVMPSQKIEKIKYGFFKSFEMGLKKLINLTVITYRVLWSIVTGKLSAKNISGPLGIFMITGQTAKLGFLYLLNLIGVLSASLAIINVLPIPVLDGGHIMFLIVEKIRGRALSVKAQDIIQQIGAAFLIILVLFTFYNDAVNFGIIDKIVKLFKR